MPRKARSTPQNAHGTSAFENWRLAIAGAPAESTLEYPLFSDAEIVGEISEGLGPHQLLNCVADPQIDPHRPVLVLRTSYHGDWDYTDMSSTDATQYHGGTSSDEIAALISLSLGIRLRAGGANRWFASNGDPKGRPWSFRERGLPDPSISYSAWGLVLPYVRQKRTLSLDRRMMRFPEISPGNSIALVRAARLYQDAVWIAESEPALSWVLLVSAVETAAGQWRREQDPPRERMRASRPELDALLTDAGGEELADQVAGMIADFMGSFRKFADFCLAFVPPVPSVRPEREDERITWDEPSLRKALRTIYTYRSKALHAGTPFPSPMCMPPRVYEGIAAERSMGGAAGALGGVWVRDDLPMFLHVFEYIVRNALLAWWDTL